MPAAPCSRSAPSGLGRPHLLPHRRRYVPGARRERGSGLHHTPYNSGKEYHEYLDLAAYVGLISRVGAEVYSVLRPGGRYVINIANLGHKLYFPMHSFFYLIHTGLGFLPAGEIIWQKGRGASGSCA